MADLIDREALRKDAFEVSTREFGTIEVVGLDAIDSAPAIDAVPVVHAFWTFKRNCCQLVCSNCGRPGSTTLFCAGCGAKMDADAPERGEGSGE